ncbi:hypothetical protein [Hyunsoonleella aestuarii]|uniref:Uncharacterized protein n=1 Tax=Hyunsoonleella aestuarii TaxID=912802 RepID=A0ABP8ED26_9FLAO|nr:hypothetical protein [Hyunsoonleella aestuarii]
MKRKKANVPIGNFRCLKPSAHVPENSILPISKKIRLNDIIKWKDNYVRIDFMIDRHPFELWNMIYKPKKGHNKVSLESRAYQTLKIEISKIKPELLEEVKRKRKMHKIKKKIKNFN